MSLDRRRLLLASGAALLLPAACGRPSVEAPGDPAAGDWPPVEITRDQWRDLLERERFRVLFQDATEPPGSSPLDKQYGPGTYVCAACFLPLFDSEDKFDSGTGWPSFTRPIAGRIATQPDYQLIIPRTEYHCARCGGHQGHVFDDGPPPTGQRWCNNGLALRFVPAGDALPALRTSA